jgi:hypothetical protein
MALTKVGAGVLNIDDLYGFRNRIINGDMRIAQRGTEAVTTNSSYAVDRFIVQNSTDGAFSAQQDSSAPAGFINSLKITTTTADATLTTTQQLVCSQNIEGFSVADLNWGTANAKTVTLSFWVRSSLTGTFGGALRNSDANRSYPFTYTISSADTWEYKSVTIAGDTTGTWLTTNNLGMRCTFSLGSGPDRSGTASAWNSNNNASATGATSVIGTLNATWYITGVQLEKGTVATPFERRPYGMELALCQRYYEKSFSVDVAPANGVAQGDRLVGAAYTSDAIGLDISFSTSKRATPTINFFNTTAFGTNDTWGYFNGSAWVAASSITTNQNGKGTESFAVNMAVSGRTVGQALILAGFWTASAEL